VDRLIAGSLRQFLGPYAGRYSEKAQRRAVFRRALVGQYRFYRWMQAGDRNDRERRRFFPSLVSRRIGASLAASASAIAPVGRGSSVVRKMFYRHERWRHCIPVGVGHIRTHRELMTPADFCHSSVLSGTSVLHHCLFSPCSLRFCSPGEASRLFVSFIA
jgi:hypothetical protein